MLLKSHNLDDGRVLVVVIDTSLRGSRLVDGDKQLDFSGDFYDGVECLPHEAGDALRNADLLNIAGKETIQLALEEGIIVKEDVSVISGIPYAQAVLT